MVENKIKILNRLRKEGFLHTEDFEKKLIQLFEDIRKEDRNYIKSKEAELEQGNENKKFQIDYFTAVLKNNINLESMIQQSKMLLDKS